MIPIDEDRIVEFETVQRVHGTKTALINFYVELLQEMVTAIPGVFDLNLVTVDGCTCQKCLPEINSKDHGDHLIDSKDEQWT